MVFIYSQFPQKVGLLGFRYDYFSCPQLEGKNSFALAGKNSFGEEVGSEQASAISSIPAYIARCQFFLALCPTLECPEEAKVLSMTTWGPSGGGGALLQPGAVARESTWYKFLPAGGTGGCSPLVPPSCLGPGR